MKIELSFTAYFELPSRRGISPEEGLLYRDEDHPTKVFRLREAAWEEALWTVPKRWDRKAQALRWEDVYSGLVRAG